MALAILTKSTPCDLDAAGCEALLNRLRTRGYVPLIAEARRQSGLVFGATEDDLRAMDLAQRELFYPDLLYYYRASGIRYDPDEAPAAGDLFAPEGGAAVLFLALQPPHGERPRRAKTKSGGHLLVAGFIGDSSESAALDAFVDAIAQLLAEEDKGLRWEGVRTASAKFAELRASEGAQSLPASDLPEDELRLSALLEDDRARALARTVRAAGGILASDLTKKSGLESEEATSLIRRLGSSGLLATEYVIICRKTSNQVNRVDSRERVRELENMNVRCSCGRPLSEERIEELVVPTRQLQKLLDQSHWMSAKLVGVLEDLGVPREQVLLTLQEGAEEVDAFADVEGSLLMFELKDAEFSMGHAYPFGGRIGLYKPDIAVMVATAGIAPDVREYFGRAKPDARMVYVGSLSELRSELAIIVSDLRASDALARVTQFAHMAQIRLPVAELLAKRLGIEQTPRRRRRR
jgi:hypothetical protein